MKNLVLSTLVVILTTQANAAEPTLTCVIQPIVAKANYKMSQVEQTQSIKMSQSASDEKLFTGTLSIPSTLSKELKLKIKASKYPDNKIYAMDLILDENVHNPTKDLFLTIESGVSSEDQFEIGPSGAVQYLPLEADSMSTKYKNSVVTQTAFSVLKEFGLTTRKIDDDFQRLTPSVEAAVASKKIPNNEIIGVSILGCYEQN